MKKSLQVILLLIFIQIVICALMLPFLFSDNDGPTIGLGLIETFLVGAIGSVLISITIFSYYKAPREDLAFGTFLSVLFWLFVVPYAYVKLSEMENEKAQEKGQEHTKTERLSAPK